jgi:hypothetical protein
MALPRDDASSRPIRVSIGAARRRTLEGEVRHRIGWSAAASRVSFL